MKLTRKFLSLLLAMIMVIPSTMTAIAAPAAPDDFVVITSAHLFESPPGQTHIQYFNYNGSTVPSAVMVAYKDDEGVEHPAYCVQPGRAGVPDLGAYDVEVAGILYNGHVWEVLKNGYPYKTPAQLGVSTPAQAYAITKYAMWAWLSPSATGGEDYTDISKWTPKPGNDSMLAAMKALYQKGASAPDLITGNSAVTYKLVTTKTGQSTTGGFQITTFKVEGSNSTVEDYKVSIQAGSTAPSGTKITDTSGAVKSDFAAGEEFQVRIPVASITANGNFNLSITASAENKNALWGREPSMEKQDYLIVPPNKLNATVNVPYSKNTIKGKIVIRKKDSATDNPLAGATFALKDSSGATLKTGITDSSGKLEFIDIDPGTFTIEETKAPEGYSIVAATKQVTVTGNETADLEYTFDNTPIITEKGSGALRILKREAGTLRPLSGAKFELIKLDGEDAGKVGVFETNTSGAIIFDKLTPGAYEVKEIQAPKGYLLDVVNIKNVTITAANQTQQDVTFDNYKTPEVSIYKKDAKTGQPIPGTTFEISYDGGTEKFTVTTGANGVAKLGDINNLKPGTYKVREIQVPEPYIIDPNHDTQYVKLEPGSSPQSLTFTNEKKPGITIVKRDEATGDLLRNAEFAIKGIDNTFTWEGLLKTGTETISVEPGSYKVWEIAPPDGYIKSNDIKTIDVKAGENIIVKFDNKRRPELEVIKVDDEGKPVAGAIFEIKKADGATIFRKLTDSNGKIYIPYNDKDIKLEEGVYQVQETMAPAGYIMDAKCIQNVTLEWGQKKTLTFVNHKKPTLEILKVDEETKEPLAGAKFKIIRTEDATIKEAITDKNGKIILTDLDAGIYSIDEIVAPSGYLLETQHKDIELLPGDSKQLVFTNKAKPKLRIQKVDATTGELLKNAEFRVTKVENKTVSEYILENGEITLNNLDEAIYRVEEFMAPDGYVIVKDTKEIHTEWGKTKTLKFDNIRKPVVIFQKTNPLTGKGIPGAKFTVQYEQPSGGVRNLGSFTTDSNGRIIIPKAEPGWYIFTETMPAPGYSKPTNPVTRMYFAAGDNAYLAEFNKYYTAGTGKNASGTAINDGTTNGTGTTTGTTPAEGTVTVTPPIVTPLGNGAQQIEAHSGSEYLQGENYNWPLNSVVIKKTNANTGELLEGAAFSLYRVDEQVSGVPGTEVGRYTTDHSGIVVITGLEPGYYVVKETQAPQYYTIDENSLQNGFLKADGTTVLEFTFKNHPYGSVLITKVDGVTGEPLAGARFKVTDAAGAAIGNTSGEYTTDSRGEILIPHVKPGPVIVTEIQAPDHYAINTTPKTVQVGTDGKTYKVSFDNYPYGAILISKVDGLTGAPLGNAKFKVTDNSGKVVGNTTGEFISDSKGEILIPNIAPGSYIVTELQAPSNYAINTTPKTIEVGKDGKTYKVSFDNFPYGALILKKLDTDTKEPLAGAQFKVTTAKGDVVGTSDGIFLTDANGTILIPNLPKGSYVVKELKAPTGYVLENQTKTIEVDYGKTYTLEFFNSKMSSMQIIKIDGRTKQPLKDAQFKVYRMNGELMGTYTTDGDGLILFDDLAPGWYKIVETKAPNGYLIDDTPRDVEVIANQFIKVTFENQPMSSLIIKKFDKTTKAPLLGARFKITKKSGEVIGEYTSDANGMIQLDDMQPGWYSAVEVTAPNGYKLINQAQDFEITNTKTVTVEFPNEKLTSLIIKKVDDKSGAPLAGALFKVEKQNGELVGDAYTTDKDGLINIATLAPDFYVIRELRAPDGYWLDETPKTVEVKTEVPTVVTFADKKLTGIQIKKVDEKTGAALAGAEFTITKQNGERIGDTYTTDASGFVNIPTLLPDYYIVTEIKAPVNYLLDSTPKTVQVKTDAPTLVTFTNKLRSGLQIIKVDAATGTPLPGARFTVYKKSGDIIGDYVTDKNGVIIIDGLDNGWIKIAETKAPDGYMIVETPKDVEIKGNEFLKIVFENKKLAGLQIKKIDSITGSALPGAQFTVEKQNGERVGDVYTTDAQGMINVPTLAPDYYIIRETKAPSGYIIDGTPKTVQVKTDVPTIVTFANQPLAGLKIIKLNAVTKTPIVGVEFSIAKMNGEKVQNDYRGYTFTTDNVGQIYIPSLPDGLYVVTETKAADGYIMNGEPKTVEIKSGKPTILEVLNQPASGLLIVKTDAQTGKPLKGVVFDVRRADGQRVQSSILDANQPNTLNNSPNKTTTPNGDVSGSYTTDANGRILINTLTPGEYHVVETQQLKGYELDTEVHAVTVTAGNQATLKLQNKPLSGISILKVDSITGAPIYNVEFMLFDPNGKVVGNFYSDNNGVVDFPAILVEGRYTIRETRAAEGYYRDDLPRTIEFVAGKMTEIVWKNTPNMAQIQILKTSEDDNEVNGLEAGTPLAGAIFEVYAYKSGKLMDRFVTQDNGKGVSKPLPLGRYLIKEVQAPPYYQLSKKELDVTLEFATQIIKLEYTNKSANTGVAIKKVGNVEAMPGDVIRYDIKNVQNTSTVPLSDFFWRDVLPVDAVRLNKIVTGTYNQSLKYKITAYTNKGNTIIVADNLSTTQNNVIDCSNASLGLRNDEFVTQFTFYFGNVKAGFKNVEQPKIFCTVSKNLPTGYQFANKVDVGGKDQGGAWVIGNSTWLTTIYRGADPKMPKTGW